MAKATRNNTTNKEETKMAKYIVEAPEPKKGQKLSSVAFVKTGSWRRSSKTRFLT